MNGTARNQARGIRRRRGSAKAVTWWLLAMAVLLVLAAAEAIVAHTVILVLAGGAAIAGAYVLGRRHGRAGARQAAVRRLEDAQRERLVAELEQLSARSLEEIVASYRVIRGRYNMPRQRDTHP